MRLIDADALDFEFDRRCFSEEDENYVRGVDEAIGVVKNAPTINPDDLVKHGEWIYWEGWRGNYDCRIDGARCSLCGYSHETVYNVTNPKESLSNYCPNCGAKMDGGKENEIQS